jgi:hypothetical protein
MLPWLLLWLLLRPLRLLSGKALLPVLKRRCPQRGAFNGGSVKRWCAGDWASLFCQQCGALC